MRHGSRDRPRPPLAAGGAADGAAGAPGVAAPGDGFPRDFRAEAERVVIPAMLDVPPRM